MMSEEGKEKGAGLPAQTDSHSHLGHIITLRAPNGVTFHNRLERWIYMDITEGGGWGMYLDELADLYGHKAYKAVKRMEKRGIVTRVADPENPKRTIICTPQDAKVWTGGDEQ